ncbi:MAG: hypothetical protein CSA75_00735 [Sorangium cellulosum]|nr:MAG: hypothetical protein CSA75_00735 [Sorangium cellulosum]
MSSLSALLTVSGEAATQVRDPVAASELFTQGREMLKEGDLNKACGLFAESLRFDPAVGTILNLAECEQRRGHLALALYQWQQAINLAQATHDEREHFARERHDALKPKVPTLTVLLAPDAPDGTIVIREGLLLTAASLGRPLPVNPGEQHVTVKAPGHQEARITINLSEGQHKVITAQPGARVNSRPKPRVPKSTEPDDSTGTTWAYIFGGVGAAGIVAASISGVMLMHNKKTLDAHCDDQNRCDSTGLDAADSSKTLVPINTIAWAVGIAGLGAGAYLFVSSTPSGSTRPDAARWRTPGAYVQLNGIF